MDKLDGFVNDDSLAYAPLHALGWKVEPVSWRKTNTNWNQFDLVVIRSTWDYPENPAAFLTVLENIAASSARLENNIKLVRWNIHKKYLQDLKERGVDIVPSRFSRNLDPHQIAEHFKELARPEIVIKPVIGANAVNTFRLNHANLKPMWHKLEAIFHDREYLVQPMMQGIVQEGEFSIFFFGQLYSHAIVKIPAPGDFRVQEEHGGLIKAIRPEGELLATARKVLKVVRPLPLYTRIDLVRAEDGRFRVMELELVEPSLYLRMDKSAPQRFARVIAQLLK